VDGATFLKLTRDDLKDIFPSNFLLRKKVWDFLEDIRSEDLKVVVDDDNDDNMGLDESLEFDVPSTPKPRSFTKSPPMSPLTCTSTGFVPWLPAGSGRSTPQSVASVASGQSCSMSERSTSSCSGSSTAHKNLLESSESSGSTEVVFDIEDFKFPIPPDLQKCNAQKKYPDDKIVRRFIRDCAACLQAVAGNDISTADLVLAATKICDSVQVLKDKKPASFPSSHQFPYWGTVLYQLKTRIRNVKGYQKRKSTNGKSCQKDTIELGEKEVDDLHAELLRELKRSKKNFAAIHEMQENTFEKRKHQIQQLAHDKSDKNIVQEIVMKYPFFKAHDCALLNELELHLGDGASSSIEQFKSNWKSISLKVKTFLESHNDCLLPDDQETTPDDICGVLLEHAHTVVGDKECSIPLMNIFPQGKSPVASLVQKGIKTTQPTLWCLQDEGLAQQQFIVVDKKIFLELSSNSYIHGLLVLLAVYFAFDLSYDKRQEPILRFFEEFLLEIHPTKKTVRYSKLCRVLLPD